MQQASVNITLALDTEGEANVLYRAIKPEFLSSKPGGRTRSRLDLKKNEISLHIDAEDIPSLRATVSSYFRWIKVGRSI